MTEQHGLPDYHSVSCRSCGALARELCRDHSGEYPSGVHADRILEWVARATENAARRPLVALLAERRRVLGLRQVDVAAMIGVGQQEVSNWERGHVDPRLVNLERYAAALGGHVAVVLPSILRPAE